MLSPTLLPHISFLYCNSLVAYSSFGVYHGLYYSCEWNLTCGLIVLISSFHCYPTPIIIVDNTYCDIIWFLEMVRSYWHVRLMDYTHHMPNFFEVASDGDTFEKKVRLTRWLVCKYPAYQCFDIRWRHRDTDPMGWIQRLPRNWHFNSIMRDMSLWLSGLRNPSIRHSKSIDLFAILSIEILIRQRTRKSITSTSSPMITDHVILNGYRIPRTWHMLSEPYDCEGYEH